jgi:hypothetical protein
MNRNSDRSSSAQITNQQGENTSQQIPQPPEGWDRFKWLGPSFLWMLSAAGSGELLFTPRIAALYGYSLLWALLAAVILKWFINNEVGRFSVCTGATILEGFKQIPGPKNWTIYLIFCQPVSLLQIAGGIEAAHIPIVTGLTLYVNHRMLPKELRPSKFIWGGTVIAGIFLACFAAIYLLQLIGIIGTSGGGS